MPTREKLAPGEFYHIYNRGVDKRKITLNHNDSDRFIDCLKYFNTVEPTRGLSNLTEEDRIRILKDKTGNLVELICFRLNPTHYHLLLKEIREGGISEYMKRINGGYTWHFDFSHDRSGSLFQGTYKSVRMISNEQLLHVSAYIHLNNEVHAISSKELFLTRSSWEEYIGATGEELCSKDIILGQFKSIIEYQKFAKSSLKIILKNRDLDPGQSIIGKHLFV